MSFMKNKLEVPKGNSIVIATGGFDPFHIGHLSYLKSAARLGAFLIVGVNSDDWLIRKKGYYFQSITSRLPIVDNLKCVHSAVSFLDEDGTAISLIEKVKFYNPNATKIIFANGGDRNADNIPEMSVLGVEFAFGIGGDNKMESSSDIIKRVCKNIR